MSELWATLKSYLLHKLHWRVCSHLLLTMCWRNCLQFIIQIATLLLWRESILLCGWFSIQMRTSWNRQQSDSRRVQVNILILIIVLEIPTCISTIASTELVCLLKTVYRLQVLSSVFQKMKLITSNVEFQWLSFQMNILWWSMWAKNIYIPMAKYS